MNIDVNRCKSININGCKQMLIDKCKETEINVDINDEKKQKKIYLQAEI